MGSKRSETKEEGGQKGDGEGRVQAESNGDSRQSYPKPALHVTSALVIHLVLALLSLALPPRRIAAGGEGGDEEGGEAGSREAGGQAKGGKEEEAAGGKRIGGEEGDAGSQKGT